MSAQPTLPIVQRVPESTVLRLVMLAVSRLSSRVFRNNQGAARYPDGGIVKYGVCNPGGSDLIGWTPVTVTPEMSGHTLAVFTALEVKAPGGRVRPEQLQFIEAVQAAGGIAAVVHSPEEAERAVTWRPGMPR